MEDLKILIVDDEPHIRILLEQTLEDLEDHDVEILIAENGQEAYDIMKAKEPQLVFLDVMMPKMNGFEVCEKIRSEVPSSKIYIILLTAKGQEADKEKGLLLGANEYITKPFDPDEIMEKAMEILNV
ncbi:MAG: response regulator [Bacteroidota bacterium]